MRNRFSAFLLSSLLAAASAAGASEEAGAQAERFGWFAELAGHCWRGEYAGGGGDVQCYEWQYGRYLRGTIAIDAPGPDGKRLELSGDSVFDWDEETGRIRYANWSDAGQLQHGEAYYEGEALLFPDVRSRDEEPRTRSRWVRLGDDAFEVTREKREGDAWVAVLTVRYRREPAPTP
jgi:hypothetical protein